MKFNPTEHAISLHPVVFATFCSILFALIFLVFGVRLDPSDRFKRRHPILTGNGFLMVWEWMLLPIINKIVFLFTPALYRMQVVKAIKKETNSIYQSRIKDLEYQVDLLLEDKNTKPVGHGDKDKAYWDGVKYGYSLKGRQETKPNTRSIELTDAHIFTLGEIAKGNKTVSGLSVAHLEDCGYVSIVWDNKEGTKYHYELTKSGSERLINIYKKPTKTKRAARA